MTPLKTLCPVLLKCANWWQNPGTWVEEYDKGILKGHEGVTEQLDVCESHVNHELLSSRSLSHQSCRRRWRQHSLLAALFYFSINLQEKVSECEKISFYFVLEVDKQKKSQLMKWNFNDHYSFSSYKRSKQWQNTWEDGCHGSCFTSTCWHKLFEIIIILPLCAACQEISINILCSYYLQWNKST